MMIKKVSFLNTDGLLITLITIFVLITTTIGASDDINDNEINGNDVYMYMGIKVHETERECAMVGGLCVHKNDCLETTSKSGLCPKNQHNGVECCYELPIREAPCSQHLGACMDHCNRFLHRPATDCPDGQVCCVLI